MNYFTEDGASVIHSLSREVAGFLRRTTTLTFWFNTASSTIMCLHIYVDGLLKLPNHVHSTFDEVMRFFRNGHVHKKKLQALVQASRDEHDHYNLVTYHIIRWLSFNECVKQFVDLIPEIILF